MRPQSYRGPNHTTTQIILPLKSYCCSKSYCRCKSYCCSNHARSYRGGSIYQIAYHVLGLLSLLHHISVLCVCAHYKRTVVITIMPHCIYNYYAVLRWYFSALISTSRYAPLFLSIVKVAHLIMFVSQSRTLMKFV